MEYTSAGCMFTSGVGGHVLAGLQKGSISGIGGKRQAGDDNFFHTALREMLEELFGIYDKWMISYLVSVEHERIVKRGSYIIVVYSMGALEQMMQIIKNHGRVSDLYSEFPLCVNDLVFKRCVKGVAHVELPILCILPAVSWLELEKSFVSDFTMFQ